MEVERYWGPKFGEAPPSRPFDSLTRLVPRCTSKRLQVDDSPTMELVMRAIQRAGNSSPVPSLLPFSVRVFTLRRKCSWERHWPWRIRWFPSPLVIFRYAG